MKFALAIDIGASSGRHIVGWRDPQGQIQTEEVYRFQNGAEEAGGHLQWDVTRLLQEVKNGMRAALQKYPALSTFSIDTWGVDYVLMENENSRLPCYAYRDGRTQSTIPVVHRITPFEELYAHTGIQFQPFNTVYQLMDDLQTGRLEHASDFLMMPEYLLYRLTGVKAKEYTNATTTGLVCAKTGEFDEELIERLGFPKRLFPKLTQPGTSLGGLLPEVQQEIGGNIEAILCATHDTASAVEGMPLHEHAAFLSSGTWSVLGLKIPKPVTTQESREANYANEGGVGYIRYLTNIMGMWLVNRLREELCPERSFQEIVNQAREDTFEETTDVNHKDFFAPRSMVEAFDQHLSVKPEKPASYFRCAYRSLAIAYRDAIHTIEKLTGQSVSELVIVGGGAKNAYLNELTQQAIGIKLTALPIEATAIGNLKVQLNAKENHI